MKAVVVDTWTGQSDLMRCRVDCIRSPCGDIRVQETQEAAEHAAIYVGRSGTDCFLRHLFLCLASIALFDQQQDVKIWPVEVLLQTSPLRFPAELNDTELVRVKARVYWSSAIHWTLLRLPGRDELVIDI